MIVILRPEAEAINKAEGQRTMRGQGQQSDSDLPISASKYGDEGNAVEGKMLESGVDSASARHAILLVEDDPLSQQLTSLQLKRLGYSMQAVVGGEEAVQWATSGNFALVLMDCYMPGMDGFETARRIREVESASARGRRVPIIALTATAITSERQACIEAGMDDFLAKPLVPERLMEVLKRWSEATHPESEKSTAGWKSAEDAATEEKIATLDPEVFDKLRKVLTQADPGFLRRSIDQFFTHATQMLQNLQAAISASNVREVLRMAHSLKSAAATFGATHMSDLCRELEIQAHASSIIDAEGQLAQIEAEYQRVRKALERERDRATI